MNHGLENSNLDEAVVSRHLDLNLDEADGRFCVQGRVLMHGFLFKKSGFYSKIRMARDKWQRRWVVLSDARLFYLVRTLLFKMFWMPAASVPALGWRLFYLGWRLSYLVRIMFLSSALVCASCLLTAMPALLSAAWPLGF